MKKPYKRKIIYAENPVPELLPNEVYSLLVENEFINQNYLRNYILKKEYIELKQNSNLNALTLKLMLAEKYKLSFHTARKIIERRFFYQEEAEKKKGNQLNDLPLS